MMTFLNDLLILAYGGIVTLKMALHLSFAKYSVKCEHFKMEH